MEKVFKRKLELFKELVKALPMDHAVYVEGSTVGQIAFHAAQSANNFLRAHVLRIGFDRNKAAEYGEPHTLEEVNKSIDMAVEACEEIENKNVDLDEKLVSPLDIDGMKLETNLDALSFNLSHLSEHLGELSQVKREIEERSK